MGYDFHPEMQILIEDNQKLKRKLHYLKKSILNDKSHKELRIEISEIGTLLSHLEDYLN
jgi:hypothetical protein